MFYILLFRKICLDRDNQDDIFLTFLFLFYFVIYQITSNITLYSFIRGIWINKKIEDLPFFLFFVCLLFGFILCVFHLSECSSRKKASQSGYNTWWASRQIPVDENGKTCPMKFTDRKRG